MRPALAVLLMAGGAAAAGAGGDGSAASPPAERVLERLATAAGELTITERGEEAAAVYTVRIAGETVREIDAGDEDDELAAFPLPSVLRHFDPGVPPFDEVVLIQQQMMGNACNGGPMWFLGLRRDGSHSVSATIDFCGGPDPVVSRDDGDGIRIEIPGAPPNRGEGYVPGETWLYEGGEVRRADDGDLPDPWADCREAGTVDEPEAARLDPASAAALHERVRQAFDVPGETPNELVAAWTVWRCVDGQVWACVVGANLPCSERADTDRTPTEPMREHCREYPNAETIPAVVTGRATVYTWRCTGGRPEVDGQWSEPDTRGFHRKLWRRIDPPGGR